MKVTGTGQPTVDRSRDIAGAKSTREIGDAKEKRRGSRAPEVDVGVSDKVAISGKAKEAAKAKEIARSAPEANEEKVARLKEAIANGSYKIDADRIANKLVDEHLFNSF